MDTQQPVVHKQTSTTVPIHGATTTTTAGRSGRSEQKESPMSEQLERTGAELKHEANKMAQHVCDVTKDICTNWRHYPKVITFTVLLASMLLGAGLMAGVQRGISGRGFIGSHWDRETADAHHALDVILDHMKHPSLYRSEQGETYAHKARRTIGNIMNVFSGKKGTGRDMYEGARETGRGLYDKASDLTEDIGYGARRMGERLKDTTYDLGHKIKEGVESAKDTVWPSSEYESRFTGGRGGYGREMMSSRGSKWWPWNWFSSDRSSSMMGEREHTGPSSWFSSDRDSDREYTRRGRDDEDEFELAKRKVKGVVGEAERERNF